MSDVLANMTKAEMEERLKERAKTMPKEELTRDLHRTRCPEDYGQVEKSKVEHYWAIQQILTYQMEKCFEEKASNMTDEQMAKALEDCNVPLDRIRQMNHAALVESFIKEQVDNTQLIMKVMYLLRDFGYHNPEEELVQELFEMSRSKPNLDPDGVKRSVLRLMRAHEEGDPPEALVERLVAMVSPEDNAAAA